MSSNEKMKLFSWECIFEYSLFLGLKRIEIEIKGDKVWV